MRRRRLPPERQTGPWILSSTPLFIIPPPHSTEGGEHQPAAKNTQQYNTEKRAHTHWHPDTHINMHTHKIIDRLTDMDVFFFVFLFFSQKNCKIHFQRCWCFFSSGSGWWNAHGGSKAFPILRSQTCRWALELQHIRMQKGHYVPSTPASPRPRTCTATTNISSLRPTSSL